MVQSNMKTGAVRAKIAIGLALTLGAALLFVFVMPKSAGGPAQDALANLPWFAAMALSLWWARTQEGLDWARLGFVRPTVRSLLWGLAGGIALIVLMGLCYGVLFPALGIAQGDPGQLQKIAALPVPLILLAALRAALTEEWLFRFYPIDALERAGTGRWVAMLLPALVFIGLHAPQWGLAHLIPVAIAAVVLTALWAWKRNFWTSALAHFLADAVPFTLMALRPH